MHKDWLKECIFLFKNFKVTFVNVFCDKDDLIKREIQRGDREIGQAVAQLEIMSMVNDCAFQVLRNKLEVDEIHKAVY